MQEVEVREATETRGIRINLGSEVVRTYLAGVLAVSGTSTSEFSVECFSRSSGLPLAMVGGGGGGRPTELVMLRERRQGDHLRERQGFITD